jgi:prophage DNA circulation protein
MNTKAPETTETTETTEHRFHRNANHVLVEKAKTLAQAICVMKGLMNMRMQMEVLSMSDQYAEFIYTNDTNNENLPLDLIKEANAALEPKLAEMQFMYDRCAHIALHGL